jgi:hypothetical protein
MAKDKDRALNPATAQLKAEKQKALKKGSLIPHLRFPYVRFPIFVMLTSINKPLLSSTVCVTDWLPKQAKQR